MHRHENTSDNSYDPRAFGLVRLPRLPHARDQKEIPNGNAGTGVGPDMASRSA
jgi:hypothetical protein